MEHRRAAGRSVPFGQDEDGLPIGLQLVGPAGAESTLLSLAAQIELLHPWPAIAPAAGAAAAR